MDKHGSANTGRVTGLIWLIGLAIFINYVDRGTLGIAAPRMKAELGLSAIEFGTAASAFFWVYAPGQLAIGWLVGRVSAARLLAAGLAMWGLATALTGLASGLPMLVVLRMLLGAGEATAFVCAFKLIIDHVPAARVGVAFGAVSVAIGLGPAIGTLAGGLMLAAVGWHWLFGILGIATLAWIMPWLRITARLPAPAADSTVRAGPSYWQVFANRPALSLSLAQICWAFALYFLVTWLPLWLVDARGYSITDMAWLGSLVFVAQALAGFIGGRFNDRLLARGMPTGVVRRTCAVSGQVLIVTGIAILPLSTTQSVLIVGLLLAGFGLGLTHVSINLAAQTFAGSLAVGKWVGVQNGIGNLAGIANPLITGAILDATGNYGWAFALAGGAQLIGMFSVIMLVPAIAPIDWDRRGSAGSR